MEMETTGLGRWRPQDWADGKAGKGRRGSCLKYRDRVRVAGTGGSQTNSTFIECRFCEKSHSKRDQAVNKVDERRFLLLWCLQSGQGIS